MSPYTAYLVETFFTLVGVCALAVVILWGARRAGAVRAKGPITLYGHLQLEPRRAIYLVKVGTQVFVVGVGENGFSKLGEIPEAALPADNLPAPPAFGDVLLRALTKRGPSPAASEEDAAMAPKPEGLT